jgi:hypothetical protein
LSAEVDCRALRGRGEFLPPSLDPSPLDTAGCLHFGGEEAPDGIRSQSLLLARGHHGVQDRGLPLRVVNRQIGGVFGPRNVAGHAESLLGE